MKDKFAVVYTQETLNEFEIEKDKKIYVTTIDNLRYCGVVKESPSGCITLEVIEGNQKGEVVEFLLSEIFILMEL